MIPAPKAIFPSSCPIKRHRFKLLKPGEAAGAESRQTYLEMCHRIELNVFKG